MTRRGRAGDAHELTVLMLASSAYVGDYHAIIADYPVTPEMIARNESWVAEAGRERLGSYSLDVGASELDLMFVADAAQGRGTGAALFRHLTDRAEVLGLRRVQIVAHPPAADFYRRLGAIDAGEIAPSGRATWARPVLESPIKP